MKNQKGFIPVIIILVVLLGFAGVYYLGTLRLKSAVETPTTTPIVSMFPSSVATSKSATPDPTVNWRTYPPSTTIGLSYSFKYPETTEMTEAQDLVYFKTGNTTIYHRFLGKQTDLLGAMDNFKPWGTNESVVFSNDKKQVSYGLLTGYKLTSSDGNNTFLFLGSSKLNGILVFNHPTVEISSGKLLDQILSTVKFTN